MQKRTFFMLGFVMALTILLSGSSSLLAQDPCADAQPESCVICHYDAGSKHQAVYNNYADASAFKGTIDSVASVSTDSGTYNVTVEFTITKNGVPFVDPDNLSTLEQMRMYAVQYDSGTRMFGNDHRLSRNGSGVVNLGGGQYSVTSEMDYAPEQKNALVYLYLADGLLDTEGMSLYSDVANTGFIFGDVTAYESAANVSGCEKCHGKPYMKHGYRSAELEGVPDFAACKVCHYDTRTGGHEDWQILVDNPKRYAEIHAGDALTADEEAQYAYTANIMNDVHMSHAMEFPYPQSMSNCVTCHEGKLDGILSDSKFKVETCKSCHPVNGPAEGTDPHRAPALATIIPHSVEMGVCSSCHKAGALAPTFNEIHTGYDKVIYTDSGQKYSEAIAVTIDDASVADNKITIKFSATEVTDIEGIDVASIIPTVMVGMYGWDTKDFIIGPHERLVDDNNDGEIARGDDRALEYEVGDEHPRGTTVSAAGGAWEVVMDMSTWGDLIADGTVKRVEIAVMPELDNADGIQVAIDSPSRTFDLATNAFDDDFYNPIVKVTDGCNTCHEALATTFHSPDRGGNIVTCRLCHITKSRGSHLEMQSRSIDSYVHTIHSFQAFDIGDVNFADPVETVHYDLHVGHVYPNFTIKNCESCHNEGTYEVPDQSKSLPGAISASDSPLQGWDRNIGEVPLYITGPGSRACGSCHRSGMINEDNAGELIAFNQHTKQGGYLIEGGDDYTITLGEVIVFIMSLFK